MEMSADTSDLELPGAFVRFMSIMPAGDSACRSNTRKVFNAFWLSSFFNAADEL